VIRSLFSARSFFRDPIGYVSAQGDDGAPLPLAAGPSRFVLVRDPQAVWRILVTDADSFRPGKWKRRARRFVGDTLNTLDGEEHRRRRVLLQPSLDRRRIARFAPAIAAQVEGAQRGWREGARLRFRDELDRLSLPVAAEVLLSAELDRELATSLGVVMAGVPRFTPPLPGTRAARALARVESAVAALVAERRGSRGSEDDLLSALLRSGLPEETVRGEVIAFLLAAVDEPPSALEAAWYLLGRHPDVRERLEAELDEGKREYVDAVLRETLRLFPPARYIDRCPVGNGRTNVVVSPLVTHRDPRLYERPSEFVPERWLVMDERPRGAYLPFGAGRHACIGEPLARAIMTETMTGVARRWRLHVDPDAPAPGPRAARLEVTLERR
jgi:cyclooctat-9-en-7-ol 5-monooxygenase